MSGANLLPSVLLISLVAALELSGPAAREVAHGVFSFTSTGLYISMFIITEEGVMVIDPDNVAHSRAMLEAIRKETSAPIRFLFYSHNHYDHSKGGQVWKDEGATIVAHIEAYEFIRANPSPDLLVPDMTWSGNSFDVTLGGVTLQLFYFGLSHGLGMTSFLLPQQKVGFIADTATPGRVPFQYFPDFNIPGMERTLRRYLQLDVDKIVFSHNSNSDPLQPGSKEDIQFVLDYVRDIRVGIREELERGTPPLQVAETLQLSKYEDIPFYKEYFPLNVQAILFDQLLGPIGWRPQRFYPNTLPSTPSTPPSYSSVQVKTRMRK